MDQAVAAPRGPTYWILGRRLTAIEIIERYGEYALFEVLCGQHRTANYDAPEHADTLFREMEDGEATLFDGDDADECQLIEEAIHDIVFGDCANPQLALTAALCEIAAARREAIKDGERDEVDA